MKEIRFHGRGGQGLVKAAHLIVEAVVEKGGYAQFVPFFGVERKGSPVYGFLRISDSPINVKTQVYTPDLLLVFDESLLTMPQTFDGFREGGTIIINSASALEDFDLPVKPGCIATVPATLIALESCKRDIPNTAMLGAFCRATNLADWMTIKSLVVLHFGVANGVAAERAYSEVKIKTK